jgi:hypothetical protein
MRISLFKSFSIISGISPGFTFFICFDKILHFNSKSSLRYVKIQFSKPFSSIYSTFRLPSIMLPRATYLFVLKNICLHLGDIFASELGSSEVSTEIHSKDTSKKKLF